MKRLIAIAWLVGALLTPVHAYGTELTHNQGVYVEPVFLDGHYCGLEYRGVVGLFCDVDN